MFVKTIPVGVFRCNCTVLACEATRKAIVVDPGDKPDRILDIIRGNKLDVLAVIHTHAHIDHIMGTFEVTEGTGAIARLHSRDRPLWDRVGAVAQSYSIPTPRTPVLGSPLGDDEVITFGRESARVIHTPGHSPGSCCFGLRTGDRELLLSGDTLFRGRIGTTAPYPDRRYNLGVLLASIHRRLLTLDDETLVIPGHGAPTSIGAERRNNPFLTGGA